MALHYICNLHLGAIVLNIINIPVTAKNRSFSSTRQAICHIVNLAMSPIGPKDNT